MKENEELKEIKGILKSEKKPKLIDKILESNKLEKVILKILDLSSSIKQTIVTKLKLDNEEKEGKLFIILFALIILIMLSVIRLLLLTPLFGINLIFNLVKYSLFFVVWLHRIIKNKGHEIKIYLRHKFPNVTMFEEKDEFHTNNNFSSIIFKEIERLIQKMESIKLTKEETAKIALRLKEIVLLVRKEDGTLEQELYTLNIKQTIASSLSDIDYLLEECKKREKDNFYNSRNNLLENLDNVIEEVSKTYRKV